jgi:2-polyprenyl-3-methyl-5-hydroxy-6-metoxy-1,4-benzoquinol methylase
MKGEVILITGTSGAGKSTYAASLAVPVLSFDAIHNYATGETHYDRARFWAEQMDGHNCVAVDAWDLNRDADLSVFQDIFGARHLTVHFLYTTHVQRYLAHRSKVATGCFSFPPGQDTLTGNSDGWREWTLDLVRHIKSLAIQPKWVFRTDSNEIVPGSCEHLLATTETDCLEELCEWIDRRSSDPSYQTIELQDRVLREGYTTSGESWERIQRWGIDWHGKSVADLGCFHGYFCFKAEEAGAASVVGYDRSSGALAVAAKLAQLRASICVFKSAELSRTVFSKTFDVALLMNTLHHVSDQVSCLCSVFFAAREAVILEINKKEKPAIERIAGVAGFVKAGEMASHRITDDGQRVLLWFRRPTAR